MQRFANSSRTGTAEHDAYRVAANVRPCANLFAMWYIPTWWPATVWTHACGLVN